MNRDALADIHANPDDDSPRLVYADWLLEQGDPRGEFIQLQCRLKRPIHGAKGTTYPSDGYELPPDHEALEKREKQLLKTMTASLAPIRPFIQQWVWQRGFLSEITVNGAFFEGASTVLAAHPIRKLSITGLKKNELGRLAELRLGTVTWLDLSRNRLTAKDAKHLCGPNFAALESLFLWRNDDLGDDGITQLATQSQLTKLRELGVPRCGFGDDALRAIAQSTILANLEKLAVEGNAFGDDAALALLALPRLKVLGLRHEWNETASLEPSTIAALAARFDLESSRLRWEPYT